MYKRILLFTCLLLPCATKVFAQLPDTAHIKRSWFAVPIMSYKEETGFGPGVAGGFYFKSKDLKRISSISYSAIYTFKHQFIFNVSPKIYIDKAKRCYLYSAFGFRSYPDLFYGFGNRMPQVQMPYTLRRGYVDLQPQYEILPSFYVGFMVSARLEHNVVKEEVVLVSDSLRRIYGSAGWEKPYFQGGVGLMAAYDTRDNHFFPTKGVFAKGTIIYYPSFMSKYALGRFTLDYRQYVTTWFEQVLAWQAVANGVMGQNVPFSYYSTIGGSNVMRGFREHMFTDHFSFALQTEYRIPLFWRLKATAFASVGDVMDWERMHIDKLKVAYGVGLRCRLNDARVHIRVDIAKNNYEKGMRFYITATEAF